MALYDIIDQNKDGLIRDLQGCIQIPSLQADDSSGYPYGEQVHRCLHYVLDAAQALGFRVHNMDEQVGWCEYGEGEEMVAVLSHLDIVPEGDGWTVPPYGGDVIDGKLYGRGSMDDKGPAMCALYGLKAIAQAGLPLKRRIRLIFGLNEETGSYDMKYYAAHGGEVPVMGITPDGEYPVINGEKGLVTEFFTKDLNQTGPIRLEELSGGAAHNIVPAHACAVLSCSWEEAEKIAQRRVGKVTCTLTDGGVRIEAEGVGAHGGAPEEGENAIGRLMLFLSSLPLEGDVKTMVDMLAGKLGMEYDGGALGIKLSDELSGPLTMNLGVIQKEGERVTVKLNYRYPVTHLFEECGPKVKAAFEEAGFQQSYILHKKALYMAEDSPLVSKLMKVYADYTGDRQSTPKCIGGGTYAKMIPNTLAFGPIFPGDEVREHKPDEFMEVSRLLDNTKILASAMYEMAR
ncbi:dipeptidase PepV [Pseudoflavonifractor sp. 60]|uniref:dipeptidase PepV n=1 Tax=Pseudoflavonifractor sp. 60 TaxID=2304576 RepID=UPI00136ACE7F|nr:dipeptidase PepV [Pseudoflavonifractor sp. 60]NBI65394.1 dipeptidase PepV [Pseudoflavonifractor sp. 60]